MSETAPEFVLFVQHGWADDNRQMIALANLLVSNETPTVAPNLGFVETWIRIAPLIDRVEAIALETMATHTDLPMRIVGHSMGGLIWLEVLHRHPDWWPRVHSLVLVASPVGGADLGRMIDPLQIGVGIAADLGKNRRPLAEAIAQNIPTLVIAGDIDGGSDGTVTVECTKIFHSQFLLLPGLSHAAMRCHPAVADAIKAFWLDFSLGDRQEVDPLIQRLRQIPGMTDGHWRDFPIARTVATMENGSTLRLWISPVGIYHVFVASPQGQCLYAGFVGWLHIKDLTKTLKELAPKWLKTVVNDFWKS